MFGETYGTGTLLKTLEDYATCARRAYEDADRDMAESYARSLVELSATLWIRLIDERGDAS